MGKDVVLNEARHLHALGFAILWIHERSKRPVEVGWTGGSRKEWWELEKSYRKGYNIGVRTGTPSKISGKYLACIDVDIKDPAFKETALVKLKEITQGKKLPEVRSGSGGGSRHLYCLTEKPFKMITVEKVPDRWEICIYSDGRQMVLPPSIHPSGRAYRWKRPFTGTPLLSIRTALSSVTKERVGEAITPLQDFKAVPVEVSWLPVSLEVREGILKGVEKGKRSEFLYRAAHALKSAELSEVEILSVLTDPKNVISQCAYDHRQTNSRKSAAEWVYEYTLKTVASEKKKSQSVFSKEPLERRKLSKEEQEKQSAKIIAQRDWRQDLIRNSKGDGFKPSFMNALLILENEFGSDLFHKDDFSLRRTYGRKTPWGGKKGNELSDEDITAIRRYVGEKYGFELEEKHVVPAITSISSRNHHHPVTEYLDSLKWDGKKRLDTWLKDYAGVKDVPSDYLKTISRKVICAMVKRAYHPGTKFDYVLILEGPNQGEGKSRSIRALAGNDWAGTVRFDMDHKDFVLALQGRWITEISELSGLGKRNTAFVKAIVSEESDRIRHPYGRFTETLPRQGIFIGTTNHFQYLEDETGNRRFWPVRVGSKIDVEGLSAIRDQLFAEAKVYCDRGEPLYIENSEVEKLARLVQSGRMAEDSWEEKISEFFSRPVPEELKKYFPEEGFKVLSLFRQGPLRESIDSESNIRRTHRALRRLGYTPKDKKGEEGHGKYWVRS